jgi:HK97 family phage major capsid protein
MTREEILALDMADLEKRSLEIAEEVKTADSESLDTLSEELDAIEERKAIIKAEADEKRAAMEEVLSGKGEPIEKQEERKTMDNKEIRKSAEYLDAWVENLKGRASEEQRTLLTTGAGENGTIAVPTYVEDRIETAWESNEIVRRAKKSYFKGNLKVGYEASAEGAQPHPEGSAAVTEEALVVGFTELVAGTFKKMVKYSTEVLDMKGEAFIDYIVDEIEYQMAKTIGDAMIDIASSAPAAMKQTFTAAGASLTTADIIGAEGMLAGDANPVLITTRANAAALKAAALSAQYGFDPFDGMDVVYVDNAALGGSLAVVADLSAWQINFPNGDDVKFVFDEYTEAPADIVRVIGRIMVGMGVVAPRKTVFIAAA